MNTQYEQEIAPKGAPLGLEEHQFGPSLNIIKSMERWDTVFDGTYSASGVNVIPEYASGDCK
jgi:hypothetical protein